MQFLENKMLRLSIIMIGLIILVVISAMIYLLGEFDQQEKDGKIINIAGRQRMLSQKITKNSLSYCISLYDNNKKVQSEILSYDLKDFEEKHNYLKNQNNSDKVNELLNKIEPDLKNIISTSNIIRVCDPDDRIFHWNKLLEYEQRFLPLMDNIVLEYELDYNAKQSNFRIIFISAGLFVVVFLSLIVVFVFIPQIKRDIENKKTLEKTINELTILNHTKNTFFKIIAHDLKNPFGTIMSLLDLLKTNFDNFTKEEIHTFIDKISAQSKSTFTLLNNLLEWARLQSNDIEFKPYSIELKEIFDNVKNDTLGNAENKGINLKFPKTDELKIFADPNMLMATLRNLVSNAIKYSPKNTEIKLSYEVHHDKIEFVVCDEGVGMTDEIKQNLFRVDSKKSTKGTSGENGTGLGLVLCKDYVEKHNGEISVESEINKGTKFKFYIPVK